jgi:DMSO/TMAO reductase YedYZ molybdopterin-dependent catalytic subunit
MTIETQLRTEARLRDGGLSKSELVDLKRRLFLRHGLSLSALTLLSGCGLSTNEPIDGFLRMIGRLNDGVQSLLFRPNKLARSFPESMVAKEFRFNAQYGLGGVPMINPQTWRLEPAGLVSDKKPWTLEQLQAMPQTEYIARHVCVEGWSMIGKWGGVPLRAFLEKVGAALKAKYVAFRCEDPINYYGSIDMASAMHPQTILCLTYAGQPIEPKFGAPMRLKMTTKLGFKQPKYITSIEVTNKFPGGYWEDFGYNWFGGI